MNRLSGIITDITTASGISIVTIQVKDSLLSTVLLDSPETCNYLHVGEKITVAFKETEVAIGLEPLGQISMSNQIKCKIKSIENGEILAKLELLCERDIITSIITSRSSLRLNLKIGDVVIALIKANEISLMDES
jgi:molybdopterin-binding protein